MPTADEARALALALPGVREVDHHGKRAFRTDRRQIATLWSDHELNVMPEEERILAAVDAHAGCTAITWGKRLAAVRLDLDVVPLALVEELLEAAWERAVKAGHRLLARTRGATAPP